jgi:hypothetical protein
MVRLRTISAGEGPYVCTDGNMFAAFRERRFQNALLRWFPCGVTPGSFDWVAASLCDAATALRMTGLIGRRVLFSFPAGAVFGDFYDYAEGA